MIPVALSRLCNVDLPLLLIVIPAMALMGFLQPSHWDLLVHLVMYMFQLGTKLRHN